MPTALGAVAAHVTAPPDAVPYPGGPGDDFNYPDGPLPAPWTRDDDVWLLPNIKNGAVSYVSKAYKDSFPWVSRPGVIGFYSAYRPDGPVGDGFAEMLCSMTPRTPAGYPDDAVADMRFSQSADGGSYYQAGFGCGGATYRGSLHIHSYSPSYSPLAIFNWEPPLQQQFVIRFEHAAAGSTRLYLDGQLMIALNDTSIPPSPYIGVAGYTWFYERPGETVRWMRWGNTVVPPTTPGYLNIPAGAGNHILLTRGSGGTSLGPEQYVKAVFNTLGGTDRVLTAVGNDDVNLTLLSDNRLVFSAKTAGGATIGGVPSTVPVPGITTGTPIWLRAVLIPGTGKVTYYYATTNGPLPYPSTWSTIGTQTTGTTGVVNTANHSTLTVGGSPIVGGMDGRVMYVYDYRGSGYAASRNDFALFATPITGFSAVGAATIVPVT